MTPEITYLEFSDEKSHKFYEVTLNGVEVTIRYGRIGDVGNRSTTAYETEEKAKAEAAKAINSKLKKGYESALAGDRTKRSVLRGIARFNHLRRTAWSPILEARKDSPLASKYLGKPWMNSGDPAITCSVCGQPMTCHLQLNLQDLPPELNGKSSQGLIQVMVCHPCYDFSAHLKRIQSEGAVYQPSLSQAPSAQAAEYLAKLTEKYGGLEEYDVCSGYAYQIVGWHAFDDYPTYEEARAAYNTEYGDEGEEEFFDGSENPRTRDKLSGWPCFWQHFDGYPSCPVCDQPMQFLFLLANGPPGISEYELCLASDCPISLFQCQEHPDQFAVHTDAF